MVGEYIPSCSNEKGCDTGPEMMLVGYDAVRIDHSPDMSLDQRDE
jgi:hypothetical protein